MVRKLFDSIPKYITTTESRGFSVIALIIKTVNGCNIDQNQGWTPERQTLTKKSKSQINFKNCLILLNYILIVIIINH